MEQGAEPALLITVFEGTGPAAEFFHVITHGGDAIGIRGGGFAQVGHHFVYGVPGDQIAKRFLPRNDANGAALIFGDVVSEKLAGFEPSGEKMNVIEYRVSDVRFRQNRSKLRLPDALGQPGTGGAFAEMFFDVVR